MSKYKKSYALRVDETNFEKLKHIANLDHRSVNAQIESLIEKFILEYESTNGDIQVNLTE